MATGLISLSEADGGKPDVILIGTGSEVQLCVGAQEKLKTYGVNAQVVGIPSMGTFSKRKALRTRKVCYPKASALALQ